MSRDKWGEELQLYSVRGKSFLTKLTVPQVHLFENILQLEGYQYKVERDGMGMSQAY